jgi:hypothetical protein
VVRFTNHHSGAWVLFDDPLFELRYTLGDGLDQ